MVALVRAAVGLDQLDPVALDAVDGSQMHAVRADDVHMLLDLAKIGHAGLLCYGDQTSQRRIGCRRPDTKKPRIAAGLPCLLLSGCSVVVARQECGRELRRRTIIATFTALATRAAIAALATATAAVTTRAAIPATAITTIPATAAPVATITTITAGFARRTRVLELGAGLLVHDAHRQTDLAALIDLENLDLDFLAFAQDIGDLLDPLVADLGHMDETVLAAHEVHERTEIDEVDDLAVVDLADLGLLDDALDPVDRGLDLRMVARRDLDHALVVDVDLGVIKVSSSDPSQIEAAIKWIKGLVEEAEVGKIYNGKVVNLVDFGAL